MPRWEPLDRPCTPSLSEVPRCACIADEKRVGMTSCVGGQGRKGPRQRVDGTKMRGSARHRATLIDHAPPWHRGRMISRPLDGIGGLWGIPVHHQGTRTSTPDPLTPKTGDERLEGGRGEGGGAVQCPVHWSGQQSGSPCACAFFVVPSVSTLPSPPNLDPLLRLRRRRRLVAVVRC